MQLRRPLALFAAGSLVLTAVAVACSSFDEEPVDAGDGGGAETGTPSEGGTPDGPVGDASIADADANLTFCQGRDAWACSEFSALPFDHGGFNNVVDAGGLPSLDVALFRSPPSSLRIVTPATNGGSATYLLSYQRSDALPPRISASAFFNIRQVDPAVDAGGAAILSIVGPGGSIVSVSVHDAGRCSLAVLGFLADGGVSNQSLSCGTVPLSQWARVKLTVVFPASAKVEVDGKSTFDDAILNVKGSSAPGFGAAIGLRSVNTIAQEVLVDDALIEP